MAKVIPFPHRHSGFIDPLFLARAMFVAGLVVGLLVFALFRMLWAF